MMVSAIDTLNTQWSYIFSQLQTNMNFGTNGPGTGTNTAGLLQTVRSVGKSDWPEFNALPFVGVALKKWKTAAHGGGLRKIVTGTFLILITVDVKSSGTDIVQLADAYADAMAIASDGSGNGVLPILWSLNNFTLGGSALSVEVGDGELAFDMKPTGKGTDYVAYSAIHLTTQQIVQPL